MRLENQTLLRSTREPRKFLDYSVVRVKTSVNENNFERLSHFTHTRKMREQRHYDSNE